MHNNPSHRVSIVCERDGIVMEVATRRETVKVFSLLRQIRTAPSRFPGELEMVTQSSADFCLDQLQDLSLLDPRRLLSSSWSGIVGLRPSALPIPYPSWSWILRVSNVLEGKRTSPQGSISGAVHWLLIP